MIVHSFLPAIEGIQYFLMNSSFSNTTFKVIYKISLSEGCINLLVCQITININIIKSCN